MFKIRELTADEVVFVCTAEHEHTPVRGHFASGDAATDKEMEDDIIRRLDQGNLWAWCTIKVTATWKNWKGTDYLGACSYESASDFQKDGYYEDMKKTTLERLNQALAACAVELSELV